MKPNGRIEAVSPGDLEKFVAKGYGVEYVPKKFVDGQMRVKGGGKECIPCEVTGKEQVKINAPEEPVEPEDKENIEEELFKAQKLYTEVTGKEVPNNKKNDVEWLKEKATLGVV